MRQIVAITLLYFTVMLGVSHAENSDVQQGIFDSYLKLANEGDVVAQYVVAQRYETGKGTAMDMEKAYYWYEMAAKQNYPLALVKLEARERAAAKAEAPAEVKAVAVAESAPPPAPAPAAVKKEPAKKPAAAPREPVSQPKPKPAKAPVQVAATVAVVASQPKPAEPAAPKAEARAPVPEIVVAKAPPVAEPPKPDINVAQVLLSGKWKRNQQDADYLPSANAACLQSSSVEIVCFSGELTRNIDDAGLTYNVKSVITGINNKEAKFNLRYVYNVAHVANKPHPAPNGMSNEINDMAVKTGWQEPGVAMECRLRDEHSMSCARNDRKMTYQFVREY